MIYCKHILIDSSSEKKATTGRHSCLETLWFSVQEWNYKIMEVISLSFYMLDFHWSNRTGVQLAIHQGFIYYSWLLGKGISDMMASLLQTWLITKITGVSPVYLPNLTECQLMVPHAQTLLLPLNVMFIVTSFMPFLEIYLNTPSSLDTGWKNGSIIFLPVLSSPSFKLLFF